MDFTVKQIMTYSGLSVQVDLIETKPFFLALLGGHLSSEMCGANRSPLTLQNI